jgi:predicted peptidase
MLKQIVLITALFALPAFAGRAQTGFLNRTVMEAGEEYRYQVYVPADWNDHKKWPVILFLHGAGERGDDGLLQSDVGLGHAIRKNAAAFPFIVVMPQCRKGKVWTQPDMEAQALEALDRSIKEFHGDRERVYLTGLSMGGFGTWDLAAKYPGRFAAYVVICGGISPLPQLPEIAVTLAKEHKVADPYAETARLVGKTPVWIFHGDADPAVPVEESRKMKAALEAAHANVRYTEYAGVGHESWDNAYAEPDLVPWLLQQPTQH